MRRSGGHDVRRICWIGIDPSYSGYGLVRLHEDDTYDAQLLRFSPKEAGKGAVRLDAVFRTLQGKFKEIASCFDTQVIALEGYAMNAKFGREMAGELGGLTRLLALREFKKAPVIVPPFSLKKFVTGGGPASKDQIRAAVEEKWGEKIKSHDIADAYGLARLAKAFHRGTDVEYERQVIAVLKERNAL